MKTASTNSQIGREHGGRSDSWVPTAIDAHTPSAYLHTAIWTGSEMIVWGGEDTGVALNEGAHYDPVTDEWTPTTSTGAPDGRAAHSAVWTGSEMIIWGGRLGAPPPLISLDDGAKYRCIP